HFRLWSNGIEHRNVSPSSLMCDPSTKHGVLNDFGLADHTTSQGDDAGTLPFMAIDLLPKEAYEGKVTHLYRHDLESFIWVLLYVLL
ncbi:hypothetical protein BKA93DRAFT_712060, partial [Sparassis latifolia]